MTQNTQAKKNARQRYKEKQRDAKGWEPKDKSIRSKALRGFVGFAQAVMDRRVFPLLIRIVAEKKGWTGIKRTPGELALSKMFEKSSTLDSTSVRDLREAFQQANSKFPWHREDSDRQLQQWLEALRSVYQAING